MTSNTKFERDNFVSLIERIERASTQLLGNHPARNQIFNVCDEYRLRAENAAASRSVDCPVIAILGLKGQGKSWCAKALTLDENVRSRIPSGVLSSEATTKLLWIGEKPPRNLDDAHETYLHTPLSLMLALGMHYILLDTPGSTDADSAAAAIAASATSIAPIVLLVSRHDQMRSADITTLAHRAEGSIVLPIITAINSEQIAAPTNGKVEELNIATATKEQTNRWIRNMQESAIRSEWLEPIYIEDFEESGREADAIERLQHAVRARLKGIKTQAIDKSNQNRMSALSDQLRTDVSRILSEEVPHLVSALLELNRHAERIPEQSISAIMESKSQLMVAVRSQLRTRWISDTPAILFPYRTVMSILALTHGAWDRVVLALGGSLPSLFGSMIAWTRNVEVGRKYQNEVKNGLQSRIQTQIELLLGPVHERFRHCLRMIRSTTKIDTQSPVQNSTTMRLTGLDQLQIRSSEIFTRVIDEQRVGTSVSLIAGLVGTMVFWILFAGPMVGIYRDYVSASWRALTTNTETVTTFPAPSAGLFFTAVILSILPVAIFCMFAMTFLLRRSRVNRVCEEIIRQHEAMVQNMRSQGLLKLEIIDDDLRSSQFLIEFESPSQTTRN